MAQKYLFIQLVLFFITGFLSSCSNANDANMSPIDIGSAGPISIDRGKIPFNVDEDITVQITPFIEFMLDSADEGLIIFPVEPLEIGEEYNVIITKDKLDHIHRTIVRHPCLVYLGNVTNEPEIWQFCGQENIPLTQTEGGVVDYAVSRSGSWMVYAVRNEKGGTDIWKMDREGKNKEKVYACGEVICNNMAIDPLGLKIAFYSKGTDGELILFSIDENQAIIIERGNISNIDFSPNGQYLRYFENNKGYLRVLKLDNLNLIQTIESDSDLIGSWRNDSSSFLFGKQNYWGGIACIEIFETNIGAESLTKLFDGQELSINYFQPTYFESENLVVLVRMGFNGNSKQIWVINKDGEKIFELTIDYQYDHFALSWNFAEEKLAFQRYLLTCSDSLPEVWIWEKQNNQFQLIAKNAARAIWLP
jgi:WD40 repeat protein